MNPTRLFPFAKYTLLIAFFVTNYFIYVPATNAQIIADTGGPYSVVSGESVQLNGMAIIPGNNLRQIGLGLFNYHDTYLSFPAAYVTDGSGTPLFSWRVSILPFINELALYNQFDKTKAWDDPVNLPLLDSMPDVFRRIGSTETDHFTDFAGAFRLFVNGSNQNTIFEGGTTDQNGVGALGFRDITDGTSNTIGISEVAQRQIPWTAPDDVDLNSQPGIDNPAGFSSNLKEAIMVLFMDGSVQFLDKTTPQALIDALFTRDGGELLTDLSDYIISAGMIENDGYEWDLDNNGSFETVGSQPDFDATGLFNGEYPVHLRVTTTTGIMCIVSTYVSVTGKPIPTLSQWGLIVLVLLLLIFGTTKMMSTLKLHLHEKG